MRRTSSLCAERKIAQRSRPKISPSLRAMPERMSTKCREEEISSRMSTIAVSWSRSRCSSATRARRVVSSSGWWGGPEGIPSSALWSALWSAPSGPPVAGAVRWEVGRSGVAGGVFLSFIVPRGVAFRRGVLVELLAVEPDDAVPARLLRHVERVIRRPDQGLAVPDPRVRHCRDPEARRALEGAPLEVERVPLHLLTHTLGKRHGGVQDRPGEQEHELLAAVAADAVDLARLVLEDARQLLEHRVPGLVAVGVVHALEPVEFDHDAGQRLVEPHVVLPHLAQPLL